MDPYTVDFHLERAFRLLSSHKDASSSYPRRGSSFHEPPRYYQEPPRMSDPSTIVDLPRRDCEEILQLLLSASRCAHDVESAIPQKVQQGFEKGYAAGYEDALEEFAEEEY